MCRGVFIRNRRAASGVAQSARCERTYAVGQKVTDTQGVVFRKSAKGHQIGP